MNFYWKHQPVIKSADLSNLTRIRLTTSYSDCLWSEEEHFKKLWLSPHRAEAGFCAAGTYSTTAARAPPDAGSFIARRKKRQLASPYVYRSGCRTRAISSLRWIFPECVIKVLLPVCVSETELWVWSVITYSESRPVSCGYGRILVPLVLTRQSASTVTVQHLLPPYFVFLS